MIPIVTWRKTNRASTETSQADRDHRESVPPRGIEALDGFAHPLHGAGQLNAHEHEESPVHDVGDERPYRQAVETVDGLDGVRASIGQIEGSDDDGDHARAFHVLERLDALGNQEGHEGNREHENAEVHRIPDVGSQAVGRPSDR